MNLLTEQERAALLRSLENVPDEILIDAVRQYKDWMKNLRSSFDEVRGLIGMKVDRVPPPPPPPTQRAASSGSEVVAPRQRPRVNPGRSTISKIGTKTKDELLSMLKNGMQPSHAKWGEHLKLLHNRDEIFFDGQEYYI